MFATEHEQMALHELATKSLCLPNGQKLVHLVLIEAMDGNSKFLRISNLVRYRYILFREINREQKPKEKILKKIL
jgi:hypothetical protein